MASYAFDETALDATKTGRKLLPKKVRDKLIESVGARCQICRSEHNPQVDHRVPFQVAGESLLLEGQPYQVLCGSCNRKKSWTCEHCSNWIGRSGIGYFVPGFKVGEPGTQSGNILA